VLLAMLLLVVTAGCHGDQHDQPASRMMVFRDLPDGVEPNHPQHLIIRTGYEVWFLSEVSILICFSLTTTLCLACSEAICYTIIA